METYKRNWRSRPLTDRAAVVEFIAATTTRTGLKIESARPDVKVDQLNDRV